MNYPVHIPNGNGLKSFPNRDSKTIDPARQKAEMECDGSCGGTCDECQSKGKFV